MHNSKKRKLFKLLYKHILWQEEETEGGSTVSQATTSPLAIAFPSLAKGKIKMQPVERMFGNKTHIKVILLFYTNSDYYNNITGLAKTLDKSYTTVKKVIADFIEAGLLSETRVGTSRMIKVKDTGPYTKALFGFVDSIHSIEESQSIKEKIERRTRRGSKIARVVL